MKPLATMGCALLLAAVAAASFGPTAAGAAPAERGFAICLCLVVVLLLLGSPSAHADRGRLAGPAARLGWSFVGAFAALIWLTLFAGLSWPLGAAAATGVFCCLLLAGGSEALLVAVGVRRDHARIAVALVALLNLTAPLWLGPLATRWPHIAEATLLVPSSTAHDALFARAVFGSRIPRKLRVDRVPVTEAIVELARAGLGIGVLSEWLAGAYVGEGSGLRVLRLRKGPIKRTWRLAYHPELASLAPLLVDGIVGARPASGVTSRPRRIRAARG